MVELAVEYLVDVMKQMWRCDGFGYRAVSSLRSPPRTALDSQRAAYARKRIGSEQTS